MDTTAITWVTNSGVIIIYYKQLHRLKSIYIVMKLIVLHIKKIPIQDMIKQCYVLSD